MWGYERHNIPLSDRSHAIRLWQQLPGGPAHDPRTFRAFRGRAVLLQKASLFRCILSARVVFLRAVIRELRQAGAVSDESIMEAVKLVKSRIKNDAA